MPHEPLLEDETVSVPLLKQPRLLNALGTLRAALALSSIVYCICCMNARLESE